MATWQRPFCVGKLDKAETFYRQSLETYPNYYRALAGLGQVRAAQKRYEEAIDSYHKTIAILPMPEYVAAFGDIYRKTGMSDEARKQFELVEYIGKLSAPLRPFLSLCTRSYDRQKTFLDAAL